MKRKKKEKIYSWKTVIKLEGSMYFEWLPQMPKHETRKHNLP